MQPKTGRALRRSQSFAHLLEKTPWYHSFLLPDGTHIEGIIPVVELEKRWARFPLPADLTGCRVLDIGAWDGWFSFEAERRGASVVAVDCIEIENFLYIHRKLSSKVDYRILDFYEIPDAGLGKFDYVFFLGILYHLKHPLLALEMVCGMATEGVMVESFVSDGLTWEEHRDDIPTMEFYETDELGGLFDNWIGPSVSCLAALCRAAGFPRVEPLHVHDTHAGFACLRRWEPAGPNAGPAPELLASAHARSSGINFSTRRSEEYITCWFRPDRTPESRFEVHLDVSGFGLQAVHVRPEADGVWLANFRLPPGLDPGWHEVRLRLAGTEFSSPRRIAVDIQESCEAIELKAVSDGVTWKVGEIAPSTQFAALWVRGLGENCDRHNVRAFSGPDRLFIEYVGEPDPEGYRQVNTRVPAALGAGIFDFSVEFAGVRSNSVRVEVFR